MTTIGDALHKVGIGRLTPKTGGIYRLRDKVIDLPDSDAQNNRTKHEFRTVLVVSNPKVCGSLNCACVLIAPMSHQTHQAADTDLVIAKDAINKLSSDGRVLCGYIQPILKSDLEKEIGILSDEDWEKVMERIVYTMDR